MDDTYKTVKEIASDLLTEKKSKFISYIIPIETVGQVKPILDGYKKEYYDSRHICWAYMIGTEDASFRANDDGEPSGTAGRPILGQINSYELTNVLICVVRYFGGIKLGTSGLISAYRESARLAIESAEIIEKTIDLSTSFIYNYVDMNGVMKIIKDLEPIIISQDFNMDCSIALRIRKSLYDQLIERLSKIESLKFIDKKTARL